MKGLGFLVGFGIGAGAGAGLTYLIVSTEIKKKEEVKREEEIEEIRKYYHDKYVPIPIPEEKADELIKEAEKAIKTANKEIKKQKTKEEVLGISDDFPQDDIPFEDAEKVVEEEEYIPKSSIKGGDYPAKKKKKAKKEPEKKKEVINVKDSRRLSGYAELISDVDFDEEEDYARVDLVWNPSIETLFDEDGSEADIEETITPDALDHFGDYMPEKVFVRNENTRCVYEVTRDEDWVG